MTSKSFIPPFFNHFMMQLGTFQKKSERNRLSLLWRGGCNAYCFGGKHLIIHLLRASAQPLVTCVSLTYQVDEFFFSFMV